MSSLDRKARVVAVDGFHPGSKWEEPATHHNALTLYDLHRIPRPVEKGTLKLKIPTKKLNAEFICPICLGYMRKTSLVMECLHRFCDECIQKCLRLGKKKECPSCRIHIPSRRSLRHDPEFDLLLKYILGDVRVLEEEDERQAELAKSRSQLFAVSRKRGMVHQAEQQQKTKKGKVVDDAQNKSTLAGRDPEQQELKLVPETHVDLQPTPLVELLLEKHENENRLDNLQKGLLKLNENAPISCLKTFLSRKLSYKAKEKIVILLEYQGIWIALEDSITVGEVRNHLSNKDLMVLQYRIV